MRWWYWCFKLPFRCVPVCVSAVVIVDLLRAAATCSVTSPVHWRPLPLIHPVSSSYKRRQDRTSSSQSCSKGETTFLKFKDDIHSRSSGSSAEETTGNWHQAKCSEVLPAGLWESEAAVSEVWDSLWGSLFPCWVQVSGLQRAGTILAQDQGRCLEKAESKTHSNANTGWHHLFGDIFPGLANLTVRQTHQWTIFFILAASV